MHLRAPSFSRGVTAFIWALVFGLYIWLGGVAVGVPGGPAFIFGAIVGFLLVLLVLAFAAHAPTGQPRRAYRRCSPASANSSTPASPAPISSRSRSNTGRRDSI